MNGLSKRFFTAFRFKLPFSKSRLLLVISFNFIMLALSVYLSYRKFKQYCIPQIYYVQGLPVKKKEICSKKRSCEKLCLLTKGPFSLRAWKRAFFLSIIDLRLKRAVKIEASAKKKAIKQRKNAFFHAPSGNGP